MSTQMLIAEILQDQIVIFGLFGLTVVGLMLYVGWLVREWSWTPRKAQRRTFNERF